jgi:hypothetical protein
MSKYDRLGGYLRRRRGTEVLLTFDEIERIIGALLPRAAAAPAWWTNTPPGGRGFVQCHAWLGAGFRATPEPGRAAVRFRSATSGNSGSSA